MTTVVDHIFALLLVIGVPLYAARFSWPRMKKHDLAEAEPAARIRVYDRDGVIKRSSDLDELETRFEDDPLGSAWERGPELRLVEDRTGGRVLRASTPIENEPMRVS